MFLCTCFLISFFPCRIIRLEFNHSCADYFTEIDAVLMKGAACFNRNSQRLNLLKVNCDRRGYILKRLENFEVKVSDTEQHGQQILKNFLENDLKEFIRETQQQADKEPAQLLLQNIPGEILLKIFSYLDLRSLFKVTQTCRKLHAIGTDPALYRELNFRPYWNVTNDSVLATISQRATQLRKLDLSWCGLFNAITPLRFKEFIKKCGGPQLQVRQRDNYSIEVGWGNKSEGKQNWNDNFFFSLYFPGAAFKLVPIHQRVLHGGCGPGVSQSSGIVASKLLRQRSKLPLREELAGVASPGPVSL